MFTKQQAKKHLIELGIAEPSEEQITKMLATLNGEIEKFSTKTQQELEEIERLKALEEEFENEKLKTMTAEERAKKLEQEMQKQVSATKQKELEFARKISRLSVENVLKEKGLTEEDYAGFIDGLVSEDEEASKTRALNLASVLATKLETQAQTMTADFEKWKLENTPNPNGVNGAGGMSQAEEIAQELAQEKLGTQTSEVLKHYI